MKLRPMNDWAVIRPTVAAEITSGGLYIPDTAKEKPQEGIVIAIGPGALEEKKHGRKKDEQKERKFIPTTIEPGARVLYEQYAGQTYKLGGEDLVLVRERDILGILPEVKQLHLPAPNRLQIPASTAPAGFTSLMKIDTNATVRGTAKKTATKKKATKKKTMKKKAEKKPAVKKRVAAKKTSVKKKPEKVKKTAKKSPKSLKVAVKKSKKKK